MRTVEYSPPDYSRRSQVRGKAALRAAALVLAFLAAISQSRGPVRAAPQALGGTGDGLRPPPSAVGCLSGGRGYLRARIRGALQLDLDWHDDRALECDGDIRPNGHGIRLSFAGPLAASSAPAPARGGRMRLIFGIDSAAPGHAGRNLPVNVTVIVEGERRLYSTLGNDKCTADDLDQQPLGAPGSAVRAYRVTVRGFCFAPARSLTGGEEIVVTRFDFSGRVALDEESRP